MGGHLGEGGPKGGGPGAWGGSLDLDLDHLHRAEGDIGEELGRGGTKTKDDALELIGVLLASHITVHILKVFIESKLEESLHRIADEGGQPPLPHTSSSLLRDQSAQARQEALVFRRIDLHVTLGDIKRGHGGMGEAAGKGASKHALGIVRVIMRHGVRLAGIPLLRDLGDRRGNNLGERGRSGGSEAAMGEARGRRDRCEARAIRKMAGVSLGGSDGRGEAAAGAGGHGEEGGGGETHD